MTHSVQVGRTPVARASHIKRHVLLAVGGACTAVIVAAVLALVFFNRDNRDDSSAEQPAGAMVPAGPVVLDGAHGQVIENLVISNPNGDCIHIKNSSQIILRNLQIGPCHGRGIFLENVTDTAVETSTIETGYRPPSCCDLGSGILALGSSQVSITGNLLRRNETNIEVISSSGISITGNRLEDPLGPFPRGQQVQLVRADAPASDIVIAGNTMRCSDPIHCNQEDAVSVFGAVRTSITDNLIVGGFSPSGCGVLLEHEATDVYVGHNHIYDTGNCGIGVAGGRRHVVEGNHVLLTREISGAGNIGIYVWRIAGTCGDVTLRDNLASFIRRDGSHHGFWDGGGCRVTAHGNVFGASAIATLMSTRASQLVENLIR